jgi:hypothetical protein
MHVSRHRVHQGRCTIIGEGEYNIPTIIPSLINVCVDIMCGYDQSDVICELYFFVLVIKCDASCYGDMEKRWGLN